MFEMWGFSTQGCKVYATDRFTFKGIEKLQLYVTSDESVQQLSTLFWREGKIRHGGQLSSCSLP